MAKAIDKLDNTELYSLIQLGEKVCSVYERHLRGNHGLYQSETTTQQRQDYQKYNKALSNLINEAKNRLSEYAE